MARELDEAWVEEAISRHRRTEQLQAEFDARLSTTEVWVRSPDELVEVLVGADGAVRKVNLVGPLHGHTSGELSQSIDTAIGAAAEAAAWARRTLYAETFGGYPPIEPDVRRVARAGQGLRPPT